MKLIILNAQGDVDVECTDPFPKQVKKAIRKRVLEIWQEQREEAGDGAGRVEAVFEQIQKECLFNFCF